MMKKIGKRLINSQGETLGEVLVASLLGGIALLTLSSMIMASHKIMDRSNNTVKAFYEEINQLERQSIEPKSGTITIKSDDNMEAHINVKIYKTNKNGLAVYSK